MASKTRADNTVNERRLRPIYGKYTINININKKNVTFFKL